MRPNELELDEAFWAALENSPEFRQWLLRRTRFWAKNLELVTDEKWHQRWYRDPETGKDSETDILLLWRDQESGERVAIHVENKPAHRKWEPGQVENYQRRAENRKAKWRYSEYEIVLLAPSEFIARHPEEAASFDFVLPYEDVRAFAPAFGAAIPTDTIGLGPIEQLTVELLRRRPEPGSLEQQPWLADVRRGRFEFIPVDLGWEKSAPLAHLIDGYQVFEDLMGLANERLDGALRSGKWPGNPLELWGCLFAEHRRARHSGSTATGRELQVYDQLCRTLRAQLVSGSAD